MAEVAQPGDRSSLFWFLVEHHDEIIEQADGKRMQWATLCRRFAEHGLTDLKGVPASPATARQTWRRARAMVAAAKARKQKYDQQTRPGQTYPSRVSPDWRPQIVPQSPSPTPAAPPAFTLPPVKAPPPPPGRALKVFEPSYPGELVPQEEIDEMMAGVFDELREHDRKTFGGFRRPRSQAALPHSVPDKDPEREPNA